MKLPGLVLVFSDSHRSTGLMGTVLRKLHQDVQMVLHLGDCINDIRPFETQYPTIPFHAVTGNCDSSSRGVPERIVTIQGKTILLLHGHRYNVKFSYDRIAYAAAEKEVDVCLFGHTHQPVIFRDGPIFFMNPGSISEPRGGYSASYGVLNISQYGVISGQIVEETENGFKPLI